MSLKVKVVLTDLDTLWSDVAPAEVELGPFNQGVIVERDPLWSGPSLRDVASGRTIAVLGETGHVLVKYNRHGPCLVSSSHLPRADRYRRIFIQPWPESPTSGIFEVDEDTLMVKNHADPRFNGVWIRPS